MLCIQASCIIIPWTGTGSGQRNRARIQQSAYFIHCYEERDSLGRLGRKMAEEHDTGVDQAGDDRDDDPSRLDPYRMFCYDPHFSPDGRLVSRSLMTVSEVEAFYRYFCLRFRYMREWPKRCVRGGIPEDQIPRRPPIPRFEDISEFLDRRRARRLPELGLQLLLYAFWREVVELWYKWAG